MPNPARLLNTLLNAIDAFQKTPGREGRLLHLEDATEVLVAGDLHGHLGNFREILKLAALDQNPKRHLVLQEVVHSPFRYPTGGDKSHQLLDVIAALKCQYRQQVHFLPGNHELGQWTGRLILKGDDDLNGLFLEGLETAYGSQAEKVYSCYLRLFEALPVAIDTANRVFISHSLPKPSRLETFDLKALAREDLQEGDLLPGGSIFALVWGRDTTIEHVRVFLERVDADLLITGHIPCEEGYAVPNEKQIILDSHDSPAACCLFPTEKRLTHEELVGCIRLL